MAPAVGIGDDRRMLRPHPHAPLCTIELIAAGHAERCPGETCPFWSGGCVLARVEHELDSRPDVAALLLELRRELEAGRALRAGDAARCVHERLAAGAE